MTRTRRILRVAGYGLAGSLLLLLLATAGERVLWRGKVLPGVELIGASVSGKPAGSADDAIATAAAALEAEPLRARAGESDLVLDPREIDLQVDREATLDSVTGAGRHGNPIAQVAGTLARRFRADAVDWTVTYDRDALDAILDGWEREVVQGAVDGTLRFVGTRVQPVAPRPGQVLSRPAADEVMQEALASGRRDGVVLPVRTERPKITRAEVAAAAERARTLLASPVTVNLDTVTVQLDPADLAAMLRPRADGDGLELDVDREVLRERLGPEAAALEREPEDARFAVNGSSVSIVAHVTGRTLDLDQVADEILKGRRVVAGRLHEEEPDRTTEDLEALKVTELVSTFTSNYPAGQPRVTNIHRASELVNGTLVMPGETFSLNQEIGRRTAENGFVRAPVIYAGEFTEDLGGGVSQFATTMFNAAFFGGYPLLEYQAHTFYISRYPMGREATLSWPKPDLKFRNDTDSAIYIRSSVSATSVTVSFYGTKTRDVRAEGPEVLSVIPIPEEYKVDGALPRGQRRIEEAGSEGRVVRVTRVITRDGDEIGRKSYTTRYRPQKRIVVVHPCDHPDPAQRPPAEQCVPPEETTTTTAPGATTTTAAPAGG